MSRRRSVTAWRFPTSCPQPEPTGGSKAVRASRLLDVSEVARGRRRGAGWTPVGYGLHVLRADQPEVALVDRLRAWQLALPEGAVFTSLTAAALRGWWLPAIPSPLVQIAVGERDPHPQRRGSLL